MPDVTAAIGNPHDSGPHGAQYIAPDAHGRNFYAIDRQFQDLLSLYLEPGLLKQMTPHFERLGELAGNRLDELEYGITYLFVQAEFVLMFLFSFSFANFQFHHLPLLLGGVEEALLLPAAEPRPRDAAQGRAVHDREDRRFGRRQHRAGGPASRTAAGGSTAKSGSARAPTATWRCCLRVREGAAPGTSGLGLFALPRQLEDGSRNRYRIVRLKDKLGSRSMASGEIVFDGAVAYPWSASRTPASSR